MRRFTLFTYIRSVAAAARSPELRLLTALVASLLAAGTVFFHFVEGWSWLDAFYFSAITLTTVGYGDFSPKTPVGKLFTVGFIFVGFGVLAAFITAVANHAMEANRVNPPPPPDNPDGKAGSPGAD